MAPMADAAPAIARGWRWAEFAALFIAAPLAIALFLPPRLMFAALFSFTLMGLGLLHVSGGFRWRDLLQGWQRIRWGQAALFAAGVGVLGWAILQVAHPGPDIAPGPPPLRFLAMLWLIYPVLSALPQEMIFRVLFFHRYAPLFPDPRAALIVNAGVFSFAHLIYWSVIVAVLSFAGGLVFAHSYRRHGLPAAVLLHGLAGNMLFTTGMGAFFWSGNVLRPF